MEIVLGKLVAQENDNCGYITRVFEITDEEDKKRVNSKYVMCVQFPNWDQRLLSIGEEGYLSYQEILAGVTTWYNGKEFIPYRYNMVQFIKFVLKGVPSKEYKYIM